MKTLERQGHSLPNAHARFLKNWNNRSKDNLKWKRGKVIRVSAVCPVVSGSMLPLRRRLKLRVSALVTFSLSAQSKKIK